MVDAWARALANPASHGQAFNLGSGRQTSIRQLAEHVLDTSDSKPSPPIRHAAPRSGEQRHVAADIAKAREALDWEPRVPFSTGLEQTMRWARETVAERPPHESARRP